MAMRTKALPLLPILRSELQARILALVFLNPEVEWTGPDLQQRLQVAEPTFRHEIRRLRDAGLVVSRSLGRTNLYTAAVESPLYEPLRELVERTLGVEVALSRVLADVPGVEFAAIYGSWAAERLRPTSDIDVLVIGDVSFDAVADAVREVEQLAGREVGLTVYTRDEFEQQVRSGGGFTTTLLSREMKPLLGDPNLLRADVP